MAISHREFRLDRRIGNFANLGKRLGIVAAGVAGCGPGAASIFPLGLRWQPVGLAILLTEPLAERHRVVPAHVDHGVLVGLLETRVSPREIPAEAELLLVGSQPIVPGFSSFLRLGLVVRVGDKLPELASRDVVRAQVKRPRDPHAVLWMLVVEKICFEKIARRRSY